MAFSLKRGFDQSRTPIRAEHTDRGRGDDLFAEFVLLLLIHYQEPWAGISLAELVYTLDRFAKDGQEQGLGIVVMRRCVFLQTDIET